MVDSVNERRHGSIIPVILGTGAGVYVGGKLMGNPITAKHVLQNDTFELSERTQKKLTEEQKASYAKVQEGVNSANSETVISKLKELFPEGTTERPVTEYFAETAEDVQKELDAAGEKAKELENTIKNAADKNAKKVAEEALASHNAKAELIKSKLEIIKSGKITPETLGNHISKELKLKVEPEVTEALKGMGKLPKVFTKSKAVIGALAGLVVGLIVSKIAAPKSQEA